MLGRVATWTVLVIVLLATSAAAQGKTPAPDAHHPTQTAQPSSPGATPATPATPGAGGPGMGDMQMMEMCRMMHAGGMMGGAGMMPGRGMMGGMPMMGMMDGGPQAMSPQLMQMRGEMLKAMGDIMLKYGKQMESAGK